MNDQGRPFTYRGWHWANALVLSLSLLTVVLRKTFLSSKSMAIVIQRELQTKGVAVTGEQAKVASRAVRDVMWDWHFKLGFVLVALLLVRFFLVRWPLPRFKSLKEGIHGSFYLALSVMGITGLSMYYSGVLGLSQGLVDGVQEVHETLLWYFVGFLVMHIAGVVWAEMRDESGLVSRMIHGKKAP